MPVPTVVTIHDLIPLDMPEGRPPGEVRRFEQSVRRSVRHAAWLICPSLYTREQLVQRFGADPQRIAVNPWAPDTSVCRMPKEAAASHLESYGLRQPFVLHLGAAAPRKNTDRVLEAWAMIDKHTRAGWSLVIVGLDEPTRLRLGKRIQGLNLGASVKLFGFAPEKDMPLLLAAADMLAYPSLAEGFGLPILDAWQAGTCVLTSDVTSLPEVAGNAAMLVDPLDSGAIARGLARLMRDRLARLDLVAAGLRRVRQFTWQACAQRFMQTMVRAVSYHRHGRLAA
jgi:alpha-1,3-rhamnosyl/mannosyltransferase